MPGMPPHFSLARWAVSVRQIKLPNLDNADADLLDRDRVIPPMLFHGFNDWHQPLVRTKIDDPVSGLPQGFR